MAFAAILVAAASAGASEDEFVIQIIHAKKSGGEIDARLQKLAKELAALKKEYTAFALKDQATFTLGIGATTRMQLPNGEWMTIHSQEQLSDGKIRVELEVKKLEFKATAQVASGATLVIAGPGFEDGRLIVVVARGKKGP